MFEVILSDEASLDLEDVINFYSNISFELGDRFITNFDDCLLELENIPFFQIRYDEIRIRQIRKFPVLLHYILYESTKTVVVYGIRFAKSDPENYPSI